jgi:hypothetical protein
MSPTPTRTNLETVVTGAAESVVVEDFVPTMTERVSVLWFRERLGAAHQIITVHQIITWGVIIPLVE